MPKKKLTSRNTKAEILSAYQDLLKQEKSLQRQVQQLERSSALIAEQPAPTLAVAEQAPATPTVTVNTTAIDATAVDATAVNATAVNTTPVAAQASAPLIGLSMTDILQALEQLQIGFGGAISSLSEQLTQEATQLQSLQDRVDQELEQLETLHELSATDADPKDLMTQLIEQYHHDFKAFQTERDEQEDGWSRSLQSATTAWEKEQTDHDRTHQEQQDAQQKEQSRDRQDYHYRIALEQQLAQEEFDQEERRLHQELAEADRLQQKAWESREQEIAARETEFAELKAKAEALPAEREAALKRAKEEGKGIAQQQAKVRSDMAHQEREGHRHAYELRLQSLNETLHHQETRIQTLSTQLGDALKQVQDLAVKAIDGAANASSLQAMKEIALEQAKTPNKGK